MTEGFYEGIPSFDRFEEVAEGRHYRPVPDSWRLVITDVSGSTKAIEAGRYKDVNAVGVASILALVNALPGVQIPYVFGGDGATLLVPGSRAADVDGALRGVRKMAQDAFDMEMRVSAVPVSELRSDGFEVSVARFQISSDVTMAMFRGSGLSEAERRVKDAQIGSRYAIGEGAAASPDFTGFECRWRPVPSSNGRAISLLVQADSLDPAEAAEVYRRVINGLTSILAADAPGRPVSSDSLRLQHSVSGTFDTEARIRSGSAGGLLYQLRKLIARLSALIGTFLMRRRWNALGFPGSVYRESVTANTDFRKFDDLLRMVLDVTEEQYQQIEALLQSEYREGNLVYGIHSATAVLMTCVIGDYHSDHIHFVDGADGGYALAAKQMKERMKDPERRTRRHTLDSEQKDRIEALRGQQPEED